MSGKARRRAVSDKDMGLFAEESRKSGDRLSAHRHRLSMGKKGHVFYEKQL